MSEKTIPVKAGDEVSYVMRLSMEKDFTVPAEAVEEVAAAVEEEAEKKEPIKTPKRRRVKEKLVISKV